MLSDFRSDKGLPTNLNSVIPVPLSRKPFGFLFPHQEGASHRSKVRQAQSGTSTPLCNQNHPPLPSSITITTLHKGSTSSPDALLVCGLCFYCVNVCFVQVCCEYGLIFFFFGYGVVGKLGTPSPPTVYVLRLQTTKQVVDRLQFQSRLVLYR